MTEAYKDPEQLKEAYEEAGTIEGTARILDCSSGTARIYLLENDFYEPRLTPTPDGPVRASEIAEANPEDLGLPPVGMRRIGGEVK